MSLGEIPGGNLRGYWKLEGLTDSSGNGFNLTNNNSVSFNSAKFSSGADFGSSGTNKGLTTTTDILSTPQPDGLCYQFRFKLNSTANIGTRYFVVINSGGGAGNGYATNINYSITSGTVTFKAELTSTISPATFTWPADTNWHYIVCTIIKSTKQIGFSLDRLSQYSNSLTVSSLSSAIGGNALVIGNNRGLTAQAYAMIDEVIIDESLYGLDSNRNQRIKYFGYSKGYFV